MAGEFWLSEAQWGALGPLLPRNQPGARRTDDRRGTISGVVHVLKTGCRWQDSPAVTGLRRRSTIAFAAGRCAGFGVGCSMCWRAPIPAMVKPSTARPPRPTARRRAEKGGGGAGDWSLARRAHHKIHAIVDARGRPIAIEVTPGHLGDVRVATALSAAFPGGCLVAADTAYDSDGLRRFLLERGTVPVIPNNPTRNDIIRSTRPPIANAISSSACSAASRTGDASPPATTSSQPTSPPPS